MTEYSYIDSDIIENEGNITEEENITEPVNEEEANEQDQDDDDDTIRQPPKCYSNNYDYYDFYLDDFPANGEFPDWSSLTVTEVWHAFSTVKYKYDQLFVERAFHVARQIESCFPTCLSFGQFAVVFPLLNNMKEKRNGSGISRAKKPKKWNNSIFSVEFVCSSNYTDEQMKSCRKHNSERSKNPANRMSVISLECSVAYKITIDMRHHLVLIKKIGKKHCIGCHNFQKYKGFPIMRKWITTFKKVELEDMFSDEILSYYGKDEINLKNQHTFFKPRKAEFITDAIQETTVWI